MSQHENTPHIIILMATKDGGKYLRDQLNSIQNQTHENWSLLVSDDGSCDETLEILKEFSQREYPVKVIHGPGNGASENFMFLLRSSGKDLNKSAWIAFCDQDDVWLRDRLESGVTSILSGDWNRPALFCSKAHSVDRNLRGSLLNRYTKPVLSFRNSLVENIVSGHTVLLNSAGADLAFSAAKEAGCPAMYDWWLYQIFTGCGANIIYQLKPTVLYRQHGNNYLGMRAGIAAKMKRLMMVVRGRYRAWNESNLMALQRSRHRLVADAEFAMDEFLTIRNSSFGRRLFSLKKFKFYRQGRLESIILWILIALNRA